MMAPKELKLRENNELLTKVQLNLQQKNQFLSECQTIVNELNDKLSFSVQSCKQLSKNVTIA